MKTVFRVINGVALTKPEWLAVVDAADRAFETALGDDYGNFMEYRMVVGEMAATEPDAATELATLDARLTAAEAAREAALAAALKGVRS